jgi:crossover junction endodeoxyribonuclease RuvC
MTEQKCIMGVDPGLSGAIAFYYPSHPEMISVYDMPSIGKEVNCAELRLLINQHRPDYAVVESVHAMPKQGVSSSFNFGMSYGMMRGVIAACGISQHLVSPVKWKKFFLLTSDKDASRKLAILTWPTSEHFNRKKDDGRAEAALLALYGSKTQK